jgi:hypothetical protein
MEQAAAGQVDIHGEFLVGVSDGTAYQVFDWLQPAMARVHHTSVGRTAQGYSSRADGQFFRLA